MEWLQGIGIAGFLFFLIKGLIWLVIFALVYLGIADKEKIKNKVIFWKRKNQPKR